MKLVAAKCPNCGAQIEVDKNSDSTLCEYCNSKIIVEDAIEKYNFEISGTIEVNNLPKFENYIKLGERYYNDKEYKEAYEEYNKAVELNPDYPIAILRKGLCRAYSTNYNDFEINAAINGVRNAYELFIIKGDQEAIEQAVVECNNTITFLDNLLFSEYKRNGLYSKDLTNFHNKIQACLNGFEYLYGITKDKELKKRILKNIIQEIDHLLINKSCKTGFVTNGVDSRVIGTVTSNRRVQLNQLKRQYVMELNTLEGNNINQARTKNSSSTFMDGIVKDFKDLFGKFQLPETSSMKRFLKICFSILAYIGVFFSFLIFIASIGTEMYFSAFLWLISLIILLPPVKKIITKKLKGKIPAISKLIIVARIIIVIAALISLGGNAQTKEKQPFEGKWIATNGMYVKLDDEEAEIQLQDGTLVKGTYTIVDDNSNYTITIKSNDGQNNQYIVQYKKDDKNIRFYLEQNGEPSVYFKPQIEDNNFNYIIE